jgi:hypothetical protein
MEKRSKEEIYSVSCLKIKNFLKISSLKISKNRFKCKNGKLNIWIVLKNFDFQVLSVILNFFLNNF